MTTQSTTTGLDEFRARQRQIWGAGDYPTLSKLIADVGEGLVERIGPPAGSRVLDVACGSGNTTIPAARTGARVTGLDLVPDLLAAGRDRADAEGLQIEWVEGDAESLPFDDASFEYVVSTFGHMFAPRHQRVASEMVRVCEPGGTIGICTWTAEGVTGRIFGASAEIMPPPPDFAAPPILWGTEQHVRDMFASAAGFDFERRVNIIEWDSVDAFADFFTTRFGPVVTARALLGERFAELRQRLVEIWTDANEADDGRLRLPQEYLRSVIQL